MGKSLVCWFEVLGFLRVVQRSYGSFDFSFLRNLHADFHSGGPSLGACSLSLTSSLEGVGRTGGFTDPRPL